MSKESKIAEKAEPAAGEQFTIANEFTAVTVRKVSGRYGERLEIIVEGTGRRALLDAMQLESVACQRPEKFSQLLAIELGSQDLS